MKLTVRAPETRRHSLWGVVTRLRRAIIRPTVLLVVFGIPGGHLQASEIFAAEAQRFIEMQRDNYSVMLTGQGRLKRACSVPLDRNPAPAVGIPELGSLATELSEESKRFGSRASARYSAAKRDEALQCKNPLGKVLELFGAESACTEAGRTTASTRQILELAGEWERLLGQQIQVITDARELETNGCLSPGFTAKLTQAYRDSVRPRGVPLGVLFDRWTSGQ